MISYIGEWISHIVLLILLATFFDLLLPSSRMKKYVKLVVGLMIIMLILSPVLHLLKFDYDQLQLSMENFLHSPQAEEEVQRQQEEIERLQREAILEEAGATWERELRESLQHSFPLLVRQIHVALIPQGEQIEVEQLFLEVEELDEDQLYSAKKETNDVVEAVVVHQIEPIRIDIGQAVDENREEMKMSTSERKIHDQVLSYLEQEWNISVDKIYFSWTRR